MKSILLKSITVGFLALSVWSCKKDETQAVAAANATSGSLKSSATTVVLDKTMLTTNVITFTLTEANFGYDAAVTNVLQICNKGLNFDPAKTKEVILDAKKTTKVFNGLDFNNLLLSLNLPTTSNTDVEVRIKSYISLNFPAAYTNTVTVSAKPFPLTAWIYVPGAYQGWNPSTADSLISVTGNGVYTGIIPFTAGNLEFKVTPAKKWDVAYGDAGGGKISTNGGNFNAGVAGAQQLTIDVNNNTYTLLPLAWSIIGDATPGGWGGDTYMKFVNDGNNLWRITLNLSTGAFKFRKNSDWGVNLCGYGGNLSQGGDNIAISTAGIYTITLNALTNKYTLVKN